MMRLVVLSVLATFALASPIEKGLQTRVVNGTDAVEGEIPYIVSLRNRGSHSCGGSIITPTAIYTAAHCVQVNDPSYLSIQYGLLEISTTGDNIIPVSAIRAHERYNPWDNHANDVAVVLLSSPLTYGPNVQPITLPEQDEVPPAGEWAVLAGWGYPYSSGGIMKHLQRVDILIYSDENCTAAHGSTVNAKYHLCSGVPEGGKGQCSGDSGGPLVWGGKQWGSVSWSVKPCAIKGYPGVYARTSSYVDWIKSKVEQ